jgi:hypothetical protein
MRLRIAVDTFLANYGHVVQKTARKITNGCRRKVIGLFYSHKMGLHIPFESIPERNLFYILEFDKRVYSFISQPIIFEYVDSKNKFRRYTPDFEVHYSDTPRVTYIEVKPKEVAEYWEFREKANILFSAFLEIGADFVVVTTEITECQPDLNNRKLLYTYAKTYVPNEIVNLCEKIFNGLPAMELATLGKLIGERNFNISHVYSMIFNKIIDFDMACALGPTSILSWKGRAL